MLYVKDVAVPANTSKQNWQRTELIVWKGVIHHIEVETRAGHRWLARLQVFHGGHVIMPTNEDGFISGDGDTVGGKFFIELEKETNQINIMTWNLDDTYAHTFTIRMQVLPKWALMPVGAYEGVIAALRSVFVR